MIYKPLEEFAHISKEKYNPKISNISFNCIELEHIEQGTGRILGHVNSDIQKSTKNIFHPGNVLFGKLRPYLKKYAFPQINGVCSTEIWVLCANKKYINDDYLYYLVQSSRFNKFANISTGSKMPRADWSLMKDIEFKLPSLNSQKYITDILSTWDSAIDLKTKLIDAQTEVQNAIIQRIKRGKLEVDVNSCKWEKYRLKEIFGVRKKRFYISDRLPLYSFTIQDGVSPKTDRYNREFLVVGKKQYKLTKYNDLVYNPANLKYGAISVNKNEHDVLISPIYETLFIKDTEKYNIDYFKYFLTSSEMIKYYKSKVEGTLVERSAIKVDAFLLFSFSIPSIQVQNKIARILDKLSNNIQLLKNELTQIELQKKGLMQQLLTGKIRVQC
ncbi:MAG: restriction endonuclease subunit S [Tenericutes bacterium]|nr:restriction endonuclease subunit S [Mycoplasmatota bacterium]